MVTWPAATRQMEAVEREPGNEVVMWIWPVSSINATEYTITWWFGKDFRIWDGKRELRFEPQEQLKFTKYFTSYWEKQFTSTATAEKRNTHLAICQLEVAKDKLNVVACLWKWRFVKGCRFSSSLNATELKLTNAKDFEKINLFLFAQSICFKGSKRCWKR